MTCNVTCCAAERAGSAVNLDALLLDQPDKEAGGLEPLNEVAWGGVPHVPDPLSSVLPHCECHGWAEADFNSLFVNTASGDAFKRDPAGANRDVCRLLHVRLWVDVQLAAERQRQSAFGREF